MSAENDGRTQFQKLRSEFMHGPIKYNTIAFFPMGEMEAAGLVMQGGVFASSESYEVVVKNIYTKMPDGRVEEDRFLNYKWSCDRVSSVPTLNWTTEELKLVKGEK